MGPRLNPKAEKEALIRAAKRLQQEREVRPERQPEVSNQPQAPAPGKGGVGRKA